MEQGNQGQHWKKIWVGSAGNMVEWFDWFVYASFATYFAGAFFPAGNDTAKLMNTAGIFAVGFFMRPVGGWLLGRVGDRRGRKAALTLTVTLMSASAVLIAAAPTYAVAGYGGAAVLLVARLLQGLSVGGEYAASATYLTEASAPGRRGFASSFQYVSMTAGQILGLGLLILLQHTLTAGELHSWGWRIPFVVGALGAAVIFYLRRNMLETEAYEEAGTAPEDRGTIRALLRHKREALLVVALTMGGTVAYYTYTTYLTKYLSNTAGLPKQTATLVSFCALIVFCLLYMCIRDSSDRAHHGDAPGRRVLLAGPGPVAAGAGRDHRLHLDQRLCEGGALPDGRAVPRRRPAVRDRQRALRRDGGVRGPVVQEERNGVRLLLVRRGLRGGVAGRLPHDARDAGHRPQAGGRHARTRPGGGPGARILRLVRIAGRGCARMSPCSRSP